MKTSFPLIASIRAPIPVANLPEAIALPFYLQRISAGFPNPALDHSYTSLDINDYLIENKAACFLFRVEGQSMIDAHIDDGDLVVVNRALEAKHGQIVLAVVDDGYTIKTLYQRAGVVELRPANPAFKPIQFSDGTELQIWGVVTGVVRKVS